MKHICYLFSILYLLSACSDNQAVNPNDISMGDAAITLAGVVNSAEDFEVTLRNTQTNALFKGKTNSEGIAIFHVTPGLYEATASKQELAGNSYYIYNGTSGQIIVTKDGRTTVSLEMKRARTSQIVIKELYNGGCMKDDGVTFFQYDKCLILYNNTAQPAQLHNLCIGFCAPANAQATNHNYDSNGKLTYEAEGFIPVWNGVWYFPSTLTIEPYSQVVINICGAIDNTQTVTASVNYANADYYCMYDPESGYYNTNYYPTPSAVIPTNHYLKAIVIGLGNAWPISNNSPALVVFQIPLDQTPREYCTNPDNLWYNGGEVKQVNACAKVPNEWIIDAVEVYSTAYKEGSNKRLTADIDAGYVWLTHQHGHSLCRNIDQQATEASGHTVYQDTNNSTNDFYERMQCSLKD